MSGRRVLQFGPCHHPAHDPVNMPSKQALPSQDELAEAFAACQAYEAFLQQQSTSLERGKHKN
jgi:hypothetical protein